MAPQTFQPVIRLARDTGERQIVLMRWGLIPFWAKDAKIAYSTINAKAETILGSPAFGDPFRKRRCLVPSDAFYEWQKIDAKTKQPFAIAMKTQAPYAFAGIWDRWRDPDANQPLETFSIITTDANEVIEPLHTRMPVIIQPRDYDRWLEPGDPRQPPVDLLCPFPAEAMIAWKVDRKVGNVKNDTPDLLRPENVVEMPRRLSAEELWDLEGMDLRGEFYPPPPKKEHPAPPQNLELDFSPDEEDPSIGGRLNSL